MSVINKMLNDLDDRKDTDQAQDDVAFLTPADKPKRKWLVTLVLSIVLGLSAVWGTYYFYEDILRLAGVHVPKTPKVLSPEEIKVRMAQVAKEKAAAQAAANPNNANSSGSGTTASADQPDLIILQPNEKAGNAEQRPSTLSVVAAQESKPASNQTPQNNQLNAQTLSNSGQTSQDETADTANHDNAQSTDGDNTQTAMVTSSSMPKTTGAPTADPNKMSVSKVRLSPAKRAKKAYDQGKENAKDGLIKEAIENYRQAMRYKPDHQQARAELAAMYYGRNMTFEALNVLDGGLEIAPGNVGWSLLAAKIHYKRTNYSAAYAYLQLPVDTFDNIEYMALRATTSYKLKEYQSSKEAYERLTIADSGNGRWWLGLGTTYEATGQSIEAVRAYRKSLRLSNISSSSRQFVMSRLQRLAN